VQPFCPPSQPDPVPQHCVDFRGLNQRESFGTTFARDGFLFQNLASGPLTITFSGEPVGHPKLVVRPGGLEVKLPGPSLRVVAEISQSGNSPFTLDSYDTSGSLLGSDSAGLKPGVYRLQVSGGLITLIVLHGQEGGLLSLCADPAVVSAGSVVPKGDAMTRSANPPSELDIGATERLDPALHRALRRFNSTNSLPIVLVLEGTVPVPSTPPDKTERRRLATVIEARFAEEVAPLVRWLEEHQASEIRLNWINRTISMRLSRDTIRQLALRPGIRQLLLDEPRRALLGKESQQRKE
jgi:hypothetical protein